MLWNSEVHALSLCSLCNKIPELIDIFGADWVYGFVIMHYFIRIEHSLSKQNIINFFF